MVTRPGRVIRHRGSAAGVLETATAVVPPGVAVSAGVAASAASEAVGASEEASADLAAAAEEEAVGNESAFVIHSPFDLFGCGGVLQRLVALTGKRHTHQILKGFERI